MMQTKNSPILMVTAVVILLANAVAAEELTPEQAIFNDKYILNGYTTEYSTKPKDVIVAMIKDDTLNSFQMAAAVRVFKDHFSQDVVSREKKLMEKTLLRRLNKTDSPYVQVEVMHSLCQMDRHKYFKSMVPALILKLDHYNSSVNELAFAALEKVIDHGNTRAREARIVFNTLRKVLFLTRRRLANVKEPGHRLAQKLKLVRLSIKVLGTEELRRLPKEVIPLL